ncbi:glycosyltransferase [Dyella sp. LX-66]|uniref:glycosyltransferase n=1 Tax=unclassified Dyella TaxID=2634549 RepID=UPI001BE0A630|nr:MULTISPECIES: glycosyltransferase [unclassified Dyella]MBT2117939.1 glycosyltransferase [Dyella sp. LX-1]MBT2140846.1 glycosyltransferase [Dyella sp. LX-66]
MSTQAQDWSSYPRPLPPLESAPARPADGERHRRYYLSVRLKFALTVALALCWSIVSYLLARRWLHDLAAVEGSVLAMIMIFGIAILPGFMNAFLVFGLLMDRRPQRRYVPDAELPGITVLVAAYNEEDSILSTIASIERQYYGGALEVIVINDGSTDGTMDRLRSVNHPWLHVIDLKCNGGKANALNVGLRHATQPLTITLDADSYLYKHALHRLVERYLSDPPNTAAVAGAVLVRNSRQNLITRMQEWDYFHGIAAVKRLQSLFQGTLVAQGAFSLYRTDILRQAGGWPEDVGEDIVLTWAILRMGHRVGYCEDAVAFTNAPATFRQFIRQRQRWSRGLIEAFKEHGALLFQRRMSTLFIWWNLLFPYMDLVYTLVFIPGLVLACFGIYWLAGPMTLLVLPMAGLVNYLMFFIQSRMFRAQGLKVRHNPLGLLVYTLFYGIVLQPGCVLGYASELLKLRKRWGTK